MTEVWRDIPGYEGIYKVSDTGRVKVMARIRSCTSARGKSFTSSLPEKVLKSQKNSNTDHRWLYLIDEYGVKRRLGVHVMMLMAFVGPPPKDGMFGCHFDDIADNNVISNLYWGDRQTNGRDSVRNGRSIKAGVHPHCKLSENQVIDIKRRLEGGETPTDISKDFPISQSGVRLIQIGRNWSHVS